MLRFPPLPSATFSATFSSFVNADPKNMEDSTLRSELPLTPVTPRNSRAARCKLVRRRPLVAAMAVVVGMCAGSPRSTAVTAFVSSSPSALHVTPGWHPPSASPTPHHPQPHYHQHQHHAAGNLHHHNGVSLSAKERPMGSNLPLRDTSAGERAKPGRREAPRSSADRRRTRVRTEAASVDTESDLELESGVEDVERGMYVRGGLANSR